MCGIAGLVDRALPQQETLTESIRRMTQSLTHRGPDAQGDWIDPRTGVALGHRRLSILDLSDQGAQPMVSANQRWVLSFNGEIYNYLELQAELTAVGRGFRGRSDTEVLVEAIAHWGIPATLEKLNGMFGFAVWDRQERILVLARDRLGIKPLYWSWTNGLFLFGSELKVWHQHPNFQLRLNPDAVDYFLNLSYIPTPLSIFRDVHKLPAGTYLVLPPNGDPHLETYWDLQTIAQINLQSRQNPMPYPEALGQLDSLLQDAVNRRRLSEVPLGAFLSGGIDSSLIVALMQAQASQPTQTFTIGFAEQDWDESRYACAVAEHLGTEHEKLMVGPSDLLEIIPQIPQYYDEPFADFSQIPTYILCRLARQSITVALSGDGGDEVFAGYPRYLWLSMLQQNVRFLPRSWQWPMASWFASRPPWVWQFVANMAPKGYRLHRFATDSANFSPLDPFSNSQELYDRIMRTGSQSLAVNAEHRPLLPHAITANGLNDVELMQLIDSLYYMTDGILTKVDRASMASSLEVRVPLLDHRVVEFLWQLPQSYKLHQNQGRWIQKQLLNQYLPPELFERPKMGFGFSLHSWLRHELREWVDDLIQPIRKSQALFNGPLVHQLWQEHRNGSANHHRQLWSVLMLQAWRQHWKI